MGQADRSESRGLLRQFGVTTSISLAISIVISLGGLAREVPWWIASLAFGLVIPIGVTVFQWVVPRLRTRSFLLTVLLQVLAATVCIGGSFMVALAICLAQLKSAPPVLPTLMRPAGYVPLILTILLAFVFAALNQVSRKLGPGVLLNWITGKYHSPLEETRIFMFLDLKDSTTLAERLGNLEFSALVKDFFADMTRPAMKTGAEVSHYIGDEAVLSWQVERGMLQANCLRFFFLMADSIAARAAYYQGRYGVVPGFKAGVHIGAVVATEVGEIKSEIVFHGDVMNTTARITGLCSPLGRDLLISKELIDAMGAPEGFAFEPFGAQQLKGKEQAVEVFGVTWNPDSRVS